MGDKPMELDSVDWELLDLLQTDARMPLGSSPGA